jgi:hypothetical protein
LACAPHAQIKLVRRCQGSTHHNLERRYAALHKVFAKLVIQIFSMALATRCRGYGNA